ncbi:MAG: SAM-dependent methyltransferase [Rhodospirillaceae bacterium]|jgi:hypothetical protein|uniref:DUF938 domain-containing protein n=1 Tax=Hwanghaeella sp. 1Z406 TaxID=3402811 RepID=UPI000C37829B|nr:SAM-dependent methyltransferase [Rhodospirillales bacterium]MAX48255.1 SAM-dependent methyltransferase [Rhodospirillaceae bacterium]|tara:strand:- start:127 stop:819 length:693 start_codon:yes stop_codon:yes gene_type:complete
MAQTPPKSTESDADPRRHAPATLRNRDAILAILPQAFGSALQILEIASGTGEHAAHCAPALAKAAKGGFIWYPSDWDAENLPGIDAHAKAAMADSGQPGCIAPAQRIDVSQADWTPQWTQPGQAGPIEAIFCANMIHIAPWAAAEGLFSGAGRLLPRNGTLTLYGPYRRNGQHTAPSNAGFDASLQSRDPSWGVRDLEGEVAPLAQCNGLSLHRIETMPANNLIVIFRKD